MVIYMPDVLGKYKRWFVLIIDVAASICFVLMFIAVLLQINQLAMSVPSSLHIQQLR